MKRNHILQEIRKAKNDLERVTHAGHYLRESKRDELIKHIIDLKDKNKDGVLTKDDIKEIEEFQNMKRHLETSFLLGGNMEFEHRIMLNYENRIQKEELHIVERKGFLFGTEDK